MNSIGRALIAYCIEKVKQLNDKKQILETSSKLERARHLYTKLGFKKIALRNTKFELSEIKMQLVLY
jgi:ribosomal protein S18 acetylase RimI-like enzyme